MSIEQINSIIRRYYEALNTMDLRAAWETVKGFFASDYVRHAFDAPDMRIGTEEFEKYMQGLFQDTAEFHAIAEDIVVEGDKAAVRESYRFQQISTGKIIHGASITILHFRDGKIHEAWEFGSVVAE